MDDEKIRIIAFLVILVIVFFLLRAVLFKKRKSANSSISNEWKTILHDYVSFYRHLNEDEKHQFHGKILDFIANTRITGIKCEITDVERVLVASSAVIPVFSFKNWIYDLNEVLLYEGSFNNHYRTDGEQNNILGMVGYGAMHRMMILSRPALIGGFKNASDKKNVGIHEFVHLIDKADGSVDGLPNLLVRNQYCIPWLEIIREKMEDIRKNTSDINPYGATSKEEFYAVVSEYFFERPHLLKMKHPKVYKFLSRAYKTNLITKFTQSIKRAKKPQRNDPCPCGSGNKYKYCCMYDNNALDNEVI